MADGRGTKSELFSKAWQIGVLSSIPFVLVVGPLLGYFIGDWLDRSFGWEPWGKAVLIPMGLVASGREIAKIVKDVLKSEEKK